MAGNAALERLRPKNNKGAVKSAARSLSRDVAPAPDYDADVGWWDIAQVYPMGYRIHDSDVPVRDQPRSHFDDVKMEGLKKSLRENGQLKAVLLFWGPPLQLGGPPVPRILDGERRWRGLVDIGAPRILGRIVDADERSAYRLSVIADAHDEKWSGSDRGHAILQLKADMEAELQEYLTGVGATGPDVKLDAAAYERMMRDFETAPEWIRVVVERAQSTGRRPKITWTDVSETVGLTERMINELVRLAELPGFVQEAIEAGQLNDKQARAIASCESEKEQRRMLEAIVAEGLTGEAAKRQVRQRSSAPSDRRAEVTSYLKLAASEVARARKLLQGLTLTDAEWREIDVEIERIEKLVAQMRRRQ